MQDAGIATRGDDAAVSGHLRPALAELVVQLGFQVVLEQAGAAGLHGTDVCTGGNLRGMLHHLHFVTRLVQTHVVQQVIERDELAGRLRALARLGANGLDPLHQPMIEGFVGADGVVDTVAAFDQPGEDVVDVADGKGIVGTVFTYRAVLPGTQAIPQLAFGVAFAAEQHVFAMLTPGNQRDHRLRFGEAGQILKVAILAVDMLDIAVADIHRRRRQNGDAVGFHLLHQRLASTGVFRFRDASHERNDFLSAGKVSEQQVPAWRTR